MEILTKVESQLGITFKTKRLLLEAITHRSYLNEHRHWPVGHYERLEFLGDAVLEIVVSDFLFRMFPKESEGELTQFRSNLVDTESLRGIAESLGLSRCVLLSSGESQDEGKARSYILSCVYEAIVGALYLDQGLLAADAFIEWTLLEVVGGKSINAKPAKSVLQEKAQAKFDITPEYTLIEASGPDHARLYTIGVYLGSRLIGKGTGNSKKEASANAAEIALECNDWD